MKRLISIILSIALCTNVFIVSAFAVESGGMDNFKKVNSYIDGQFSDVKSTDWFSEGVKNAYEVGIVKGSSTSTFNPYGNLTLAEAVAMASRLHSIYNTGTVDFQQGSDWFQVYYDYAMKNGLLESDPSKRDCVYNVGEREGYETIKITRVMFATLFVKALPSDALPAINKISKEMIPDSGSIHYATYMDSVLLLYNAGILTGSDSEGTFNPNSEISRAEVAAIVARMAIPSLRKSFDLNKQSIDGHVWRAATCTTPKTCALCGATEGTALGHTWKNATCAEAKTCSRCGVTEGSALGHNYVNGRCTVCGAIKTGTIELPSLPRTANYRHHDNDIIASARITDISYYYAVYKSSGAPCLSMTISGEKTYDEDGLYGHNSVEFMIVVYDTNHKVVTSKEFYVLSVIEGQAFSKSVTLDGVDPYNDYTIKIVDYTL